MSFRSKEKWGGSRLQLRHPLRPFLGVCPPCSNQQNPPGALIFPCVCVSGCRALGFGGAVPHYPCTMEETPREGGGEPFCTLPPAQPSTLSILGKLRHGGVKMRAGRAGVRLILLVPPKTPLWSHGKAGGRRGGGQTIRLFQNRHRKVLAPGPGERVPEAAGTARGLGGSGGAPASTPHPPSRPRAPPQREGGSCQHPSSLPASWGATSFSGLRPAPGRGGWFSLWSKGPQKKRGGGAAAGGHPLPAETAAAPRPSPATSWLGLSGVAMLAFRWHQGWVVPPGSSRRNSNRPAKFFFSPSFFPSKMLPPF